MKHITAVRKSSDVYDIFYSDDASFDPEQSLDYAIRMAKRDGYSEVRVKQKSYRGDDEPETYTIYASEY